MKAVIYTKEWWVQNSDTNYLCYVVEHAISKSKHGLLNKADHIFKPFGYTALYLISESHVAIHTFPEHGKAFIQISSCNKNKFNKFVAIINNELQ